MGVLKFCEQPERKARGLWPDGRVALSEVLLVKPVQLWCYGRWPLQAEAELE